MKFKNYWGISSVAFSLFILANCSSESSTKPDEISFESSSSTFFTPGIEGDFYSSSSSIFAENIQSSSSDLSPNLGKDSSQILPINPPKDSADFSPVILSSSSNLIEEIFSSSSTKNPSKDSITTPETPELKDTLVEPSLDFSFLQGADISTIQEYEIFNAKFFDGDKEINIFTFLKSYGFNAIRLKTFVDPGEKFGYAAPGCSHDAETYADKNHIINFAKKIKDAGMYFLLDIHYSDNWADPGKQIIPTRWRNVNSSNALADSIYNYTYNLLNDLKNQNLLPEMVQIGNETTPGILMHLPTNNTDCWGNNVEKASWNVAGDMSTDIGKENAAKYFNAGIKAAKDVSKNIKTVLHIESLKKPATINWWMTEIFKNKKIPADVMGFSAYTAYGDGTPESWQPLFNSLVQNYPHLEFLIAEYNGGDSENHYRYDGSRKQTLEVAKNTPHFLGAFFWEPTLSGPWGAPLFDWKGSNLYANSKAFEEFKKE